MQPADLKNPPGLSEVKLNYTNGSANRPTAKKVRLFGHPRSKSGARPSDAKSELLFESKVVKVKDRVEILDRCQLVGGLSAFALNSSVHLRLRKPSAGQGDGWLGEGDIPQRWVGTQVRTARTARTRAHAQPHGSAGRLYR
jgi:hypothetical protein